MIMGILVTDGFMNVKTSIINAKKHIELVKFIAKMIMLI